MSEPQPIAPTASDAQPLCVCGHTRAEHYSGEWTDCMAEHCGCLTFRAAPVEPTTTTEAE